MLGQAALRDGSLQLQEYVGLVGARGLAPTLAGIGARSAAAGGSFLAITEPLATQKEVERDRAATTAAGTAGG